MESFHESLGQLYGNLLDRERIAIYGENSQLRVVHLVGREYSVKSLITSGWMARRGRDREDEEIWEFELSSSAEGLVFGDLKAAVAIDLIQGKDIRRFKKIGNHAPLEAGHVYNLTTTPTGETIAV